MKLLSIIRASSLFRHSAFVIRHFTILTFLLLASSIRAQDVTTETIVLIRHGEKPAADQGQLNFQGLNRSLALPDVLISKYGKAAYVFAPGTQRMVTRDGVDYSYIRPLITIEPTAIRLELPVNAKYSYDEIDALQKELLSPRYRGALIFVAWEHHAAEEFAKHLMTALGGNADDIPQWASKDFDSIYVLKIRTEGDRRTITFTHDQENLNNQSTAEPMPVNSGSGK